jgi:glycosyltransferase involved in cell wall biosynthesis
MTNIAIFAHAHPFYSKGGGEIVAFNCFRAMKSAGLNAYLYCAINRALKSDISIFSPGEHLIEFDSQEYIFPANSPDPFLFAHNDRTFFPALIGQLSRQNIDVFHFHHFWNVGTDLILQLMSCFPHAKFVLTIHEFLAICMHNGQMVRTKTNSLCWKQNDIECHMCFPRFDKDEFQARRKFLQDFLCRFDFLISPSEFLAQRFVEWGVDKDIHVLENGYDPFPFSEQLHIEEGSVSKRFAFFGQANPFKGIDLFILAAAQVFTPDVTFAVYGCDRDALAEQFGAALDAPVAGLGARLQLMGRYDPSQVCGLMQQNGWIVVPSIWWENSPLVIQEAYLAGRPPIVADIGGMREKIENGVSGLYFGARNSASLAAVMRSAAGNVNLWRRLRSAALTPPTMKEMTESLLEIYSTIEK